MTVRKVAHPGVAERPAAGREAHRRTPQSSQSGWRPAAGRPDPVALLEEQAARTQEKLAKGAEKTAAKAHTRDSMQALSKLGELVNGSYRIVRAFAVVAVAAVAVGGAVGSAGGARAAVNGAWLRPASGESVHGTPSSGRLAQVTSRAAAPHRLVLPDVFAVASHTVTAAQFARLVRLRSVRGVIAVDGGVVEIKGRLVATIGVNPGSFRSWTPPQTASRRGIWAALARGELVTTAAVGKGLGLRAGASYRVAAARRPQVRFGGRAATGIPGVDAVVDSRTSRQLGLVPRIGVLISAPAAGLARLKARVRGVLGKQTRFVSLRPAPHASVPRLPVDDQVSTASRPGTYLELYRQSAKEFCPGLSWTVLAAIGQIESGDGQNVGPSSAGALGPMQFLPSTWKVWGIDAFGQTGPPGIMNPYDAVPAAAGYLCAYGAAQGGEALSAAIFDYNHASWYVAEVLALAREYAQEYG